MFIENRIEERNEQIVVLEKDQRKKSKVFPKSGNTLQDRCPTRKRWVVENSVEKWSFERNGLFSTTQNKQLFAKLKQEANLKSLKFQKRKKRTKQAELFKRKRA